MLVELRLTFFVEHDLPFLIVDHFGVFKSIFTKSAIAQNVKYK